MPDCHTRLKRAGDTLLDCFAFRNHVRAGLIPSRTVRFISANPSENNSLWLQSRDAELEIRLAGLSHYVLAPWDAGD